jgi:recombination protein RecA
MPMSLDKYKSFIKSASAVNIVQHFPFSLLSLNLVIGDIAGIRAGRIVQLIGNPSSGKSTLALDLIANAQRNNVKCAYVDFERTFDPNYSKVIGVDLDKLQMVKPDFAEQGLEITELLIKEGGTQLVVIDSIPAAVPSTESEKGYNDSEKMAVAASYITRFCRRIVPIVDNYNALVVILNQYRANISTLARSESKPYGPRALGYASSLIIELTRIKNEDLKTIVQARATKNKMAPERKIAEFTLTYGRGPEIETDLMLLAEQYGIVTKRGAWYVYGDLKAQGVENAKLTFPLEEIRLKLLEEVAHAGA